MITHSGINELDFPERWLVQAGFYRVLMSTVTTQPVFCAPQLADCRTCGAPDQRVGVKCHYCAKVVKA